MSMGSPQQYPAQPSDQGRIVEMLTGWKPALFEMRQSILASVSVIFTALQARVDDLAAVVSGLAAAVTRIDALVGQQTTGSAGNNSTGGAVALGAGFGSYAVITFNVPAGYSVAAVNANSAAAVSATQPVQMATRIGGADGSTMNVYPNGGFGNGAANFSRVFTVSSGGTFTVETRALASGGGSALLTTAAGVTFYR